MKIKLLQISIGLLLLTQTTFAQKVNLVLNKGDKYKMETTVDSKINMQQGGQDIDITTSGSSVSESECLKSTKDSIDITMKMTKAKTKALVMGRNMEYDSEKKKGNDENLEGVFKKLIGVSKPFTINNSGKIIKEETKPKKEDNENPMGSMMGGKVESKPTALYIETLLNREIKSGDSWVDSTEEKGVMNTKSVTNYVVISIEKDIAKIMSNNVQNIKGTKTIQGMDMDITSTVKNLTTYNVNMKTAVIIDSESTINGDTSMEFSGQSMPSTSTTKVKTIYTKL